MYCHYLPVGSINFTGNKTPISLTLLVNMVFVTITDDVSIKSVNAQHYLTRLFAQQSRPLFFYAV